MKTIFYLALLFFIGTLVYNVISMDMRMSMFAEQNQPYIIGLCAGVCGILLTGVLLKYQTIKEKRTSK